MPAVVDFNKCVGSGECVDVCPCAAIEVEEEKAIVDLDLCTSCGACITVCPTQAIKME